MNLLGILLMAIALVLLYYILKGWFLLEIRAFRKSHPFLSRLLFSKPNKTRNRKAPKLTPKQKGDRFEKFVTTLLPRADGFKLLEWRGDKFHAGVYAASNHYRDLEYQYQSISINYKFALECKWRSGFSNGMIKLCEPQQLYNYNQFARSRKLPVFIVLGVGGLPDAPEELFVFPLTMLTTNMVQREKILCYKRESPLEKFVFDGTKLKAASEKNTTFNSAEDLTCTQCFQN